MKILIFILLIGCWLALFLSGFGIYAYSEQVAYADGSRHTRCYYVKATSIVKQDIALAGRVGVVCPRRI